MNDEEELLVKHARDMFNLLYDIWDRVDGINLGRLSVNHQEEIEKLLRKLRIVNRHAK